MQITFVKLFNEIVVIRTWKFIGSSVTINADREKNTKCSHHSEINSSKIKEMREGKMKKVANIKENILKSYRNCKRWR